MMKFIWFVFGVAVCLSLSVFMSLWANAGFNAWLLLMSVALPISMAGINGLLPNQDASVF